MESNAIPKIVETGDSLSVFKAAQLHAKIVEAYTTSDTIEIDLSKITDCDTAGIQLLYSLKKSGLRDGKNIIIKNISSAVENALNRMYIPVNTVI
jgi:anti-anti-sigma regulatory factor